MRISDWSSDVCSSDLSCGWRCGSWACAIIARGDLARGLRPRSLPHGQRASSGAWSRLQALDDFLEAGDAAPADFQRLGAVPPDRVAVAAGLAAQFDPPVAPNPAVGVDAAAPCAGRLTIRSAA